MAKKVVDKERLQAMYISIKGVQAKTKESIDSIKTNLLKIYNPDDPEGSALYGKTGEEFENNIKIIIRNLDTMSEALEDFAQGIDNKNRQLKAADNSGASRMSNHNDALKSSGRAMSKNSPT